MKYRVTYIILFLFAIIFQLSAQISYVEYQYVDGTKEKNTIEFERMSFLYSQSERLTYMIRNIYIADVFDTLTPMDPNK